MSQYPALYNSARWKRIRKAQLASEPLCRMCAQQGKTTAARIVDHVEPHRGDPLRFYTSELQSLCKSCHDSHKQRLEKSGRVMGCDAQGNPIGGWLA